MATYDLQTLVETDIKASLPADIVAEIVSQAPFATVPGIFNLRDISNATTPSSAFPPVVRPGFAYRSAAPLSELPDGGATALTTLGIKKIYDLRRPDERTKKPSPVVEGIEVIWIPDALEGKPPVSATEPVPDPERSTERLIDMYLSYLVSHAPVYRAVFEHIRDEPEKGFLFHCSAGKDRTGVLAALIHRLAGSSDEAIIHDFTLTRVGLEPGRPALLAAMQSLYGKSAWDNPVLLVLWGVHAAGMTGFLKALDENHGGAIGYLQSLGFGEADVRRIRENLVIKKLEGNL